MLFSTPNWQLWQDFKFCDSPQEGDACQGLVLLISGFTGWEENWLARFKCERQNNGPVAIKLLFYLNDLLFLNFFRICKINLTSVWNVPSGESGYTSVGTSVRWHHGGSHGAVSLSDTSRRSQTLLKHFCTGSRNLCSCGPDVSPSPFSRCQRHFSEWESHRVVIYYT